MSLTAASLTICGAPWQVRVGGAAATFRKTWPSSRAIFTGNLVNSTDPLRQRLLALQTAVRSFSRLLCLAFLNDSSSGRRALQKGGCAKTKAFIAVEDVASARRVKEKLAMRAFHHLLVILSGTLSIVSEGFLAPCSQKG